MIYCVFHVRSLFTWYYPAAVLSCGEMNRQADLSVTRWLEANRALPTSRANLLCCWDSWITMPVIFCCNQGQGGWRDVHISCCFQLLEDHHSPWVKSFFSSSDSLMCSRRWVHLTFLSGWLMMMQQSCPSCRGSSEHSYKRHTMLLPISIS